MKSLFSSAKKTIFRPVRWFFTRSRKKKLLILIGLFVTIGLIFSAISKNSARAGYTMTTVTRGDVTETVSETGKITTNNQIDVYSPTNGIVSSVLVANGDPVTAGQELIMIKSSATEQERSAALAQYLTAKNSLDTAQASLLSLQATMFSQWDTFKELAESDDYEDSNGTPKYNQRALPEFHIAEKDWLAAEANYKKQQNVISQAQAAVSSTYLLYQATLDATVKATADGTVANLSVTPGNSVLAKLVTTSPTPLLTIANHTVTEAVVQLSETDIAKVGEGQVVTIDVSAVDNGSYQGVVTRVDTIGTEVSGVVFYRAYIQITNADDKLRPGMTIDADITTTSRNGVLTVPNAAVKPYQGGRAVRVIDAMTKQISYKMVEVGIKGKQTTEIIDGLVEGEEIILSLSNEQLKRPGLFGN